MLGGYLVSLWNCFWRNCFWPLLLLILLGLLQMFWFGDKWRKIEEDVKEKVSLTLQSNGVDWANVDTHNRGRDVLLSGSAPSDEAKSMAMRIAADLSKDQRGNQVARIVEWKGEIVKPVPVLEPGNLSFSVVDGKITLNGVVSSLEQEKSLISAANAAYGDDNVTNLLTVKENIVPIENIGSLITAFGLKDGTLRLSLNKILKITGGVPSEENKTSIGDSFQQVLGSGYSLNNALTVNAPEPAPEAIVDTAALCQAKVQELMADSKIFFAINKADIKPASFELLDNIAVVLNECSSSVIQVSGHTDSSGSQAVNQPLSLGRAQAVVDYLISKGVEANRLSSAGFGADNPIADNATKQGRAANRRIEFTVK